MLIQYDDILSRIPEPPTWWDRHGCPRYNEPIPENCSHVYADRLTFMRIECQGCGQEFIVEFASSRMNRLNREGTEILEVDPTLLQYGDPPNIGCCSAGATMSSYPREIIAHYERGKMGKWNKTHENVPVKADWDREDDEWDEDLVDLFEES